MSSYTRSIAVLLSLVVTASVAAGTVGGAGGVGVATATTQDPTDEVTELSECRQVTESGRYVLTQDLQTNETCVRIMADDVTIDGNGHTITGADDSATAVRVRAALDPELAEPTDNATVTNLTTMNADIVWENGDTGTVDGVSLTNGSVDLGMTSQGRVLDSHVEHGEVTARMGADNVTVRNTSLVDAGVGLGSFVRDVLVTGVSGDGATVAVHESEDVTIRDNELTEVYLSGATNVTIADNRPDDAGRFGVWIASISAKDVTVTGNTITGNTANASQSAGIRAQSVHTLTVTNNEIAGNENGIVVLDITNRERTTTVCGDRQTEVIEGSVEVHGNDLSENSNGVVNHDGEIVVHAVQNYWGADGPSSTTGEPLEDPQTDTLADGDGSAVSEDPDDPGVSNVRFDPWLDQSPVTNETNTDA